jgi:integrase
MKRIAALELEPGTTVGQRSIRLFTVDHWEAIFIKHLEKLSNSSWNKYRQAVLSLQAWAVDKQYLVTPWLSGKVIRKGGKIARRKGARRDRRLVPDRVNEHGKVTQPGEERRLMLHASPWLQRVIMAALEGCMRRNEILSLQWRDVSLAHGRITLRAENTKTRTMRQIPISPRLLAVLKLLQMDPEGKEHSPTAYVFGDVVGGQMLFQKKAWAATLKGAKIEDLEFRDLRHEGASRLADRGWSLPQIQRMCRHQDAKTTSIYLNTTIHDLEDAMRRKGTGQLLHTVPQTTKNEPPPLCNDDEETATKPLIN